MSMMFTLARVDVSVFFEDPRANSVYVFITMVELQVHFSGTNWLLLDINTLCYRESRTNIVCSLARGLRLNFLLLSQEV